MGSNKPEVIVFDMDGVLVDVTDSYRETIVRTVEHFTGAEVTRARIQEYKNMGGYNNDWLLSQHMARDLGVEVAYERVAAHFNSLFLDGGLIHRERWIAQAGLLERLAASYELAIFTGRPRREAQITLEREGWLGRFHLVTLDDVEHEKPSPDGLFKIAAAKPGKRMVYLGDTVDDARSGKAAGVPFIGIAAHDDGSLLYSEGAYAVLRDINSLESVL
jgi:HAD superfamily phosphatase